MFPSPRRDQRAGSLRRSGSIRSNCSAGPRSRISAVQTRNAAATAPGLRAQARPPGTEFLDAETGRQKSSTNARTPTETKIQELSTRKSAQKRPIWRRVGNAWFERTGWWCAQSNETGLQANNREFFENFSPKQASDELVALAPRKFERDPSWLHNHPG